VTVSLLTRAVLAVACVACAAWLVAGLAPVRDQAAALSLVSGRRAPSPSTVDRADQLLREAAAATRSPEPDLRRAELFLVLRRDAAAARLASGVVHDEPDNREGWVVLAQATAASDPALAARARARLRALSPPVGPAR
jgi:predicted Zn-dependent protease